MQSEAVLRMFEQTWREMRRRTDALNSRVSRVELQTRAETAGGFVAYSLATAPTAAAGGMSDGQFYIDVAWINDGLRPGETTGNGTGVLAFYDAATDTWRNLHDYAAVTT